MPGIRRNPIIGNPIMYTSSTSSTDIHYQTHDPPLLAGVHCVSGEERPVQTRGLFLTLSSHRQNLINCVERPADQIHNSQLGRYAKRGSERRQDTEQKQGRQGRVRETGEKRPPPPRAETERVRYSVQTIIHKDKRHEMCSHPTIQ
ncbi:hypothetical protein XENORESO_004231 [Xenotaenia resolanae]|uniref:Uncharacterized protein n=1 Tax=Xenotaenia resolanae TaxID=208358 RepID=A0ABV0VNZ9_9TELE